MNVHSYILKKKAMTGKKERKDKAAAQRREQILKAALEVFSQKGFAAATVPEIAKAAGVAAGTIYLYYPSKRELFIAVIKNFIITPPLLKLIDRMPEGDIGSIFKKIIKDRFDLIKNPTFARLPVLMGDVQRDPELKALWLKDFLHPFLGQMAPGYSFMSMMGKFRRYDPEVAVRLIGGLIMGFLMFRVIEGDTSPLNKMDQEKVTEDIVNFVLHGMLNETNNEKDGKK
jgi:AcrR family transcriptional regulator